MEMDLLKLANAAMSDYTEKIADAMARAFQRGEIRIDSADKQIAFNEKMEKLPPRQSGNMGMLAKKHFASGAEGKVYLGAMRGEGLGVRKTFEPPIAGSQEAEYYFNKLQTRTVKNRVEHMKEFPEIYPKVYGHKSSKNPRYGHVDMEFIPGKELKHHDFSTRRKANAAIDSAMRAKGFKDQPVYAHPTYYNRDKDVVVGDLHAANVKIDARTGKPKIVDPMVYRGHDPNLPKEITLSRKSIKDVPSLELGKAPNPSSQSFFDPNNAHVGGAGKGRRVYMSNFAGNASSSGPAKGFGMGMSGVAKDNMARTLRRDLPVYAGMAAIAAGVYGYEKYKQRKQNKQKE
jgi:hypothetical protein